MDRRGFLFAGGVLLGSAWWLRPADQGRPYSDYFRKLNRQLRQQGPGRPLMLIDVPRLDHNIERIQKMRPAHQDFRIVAKSLPCPALLARIMQAMSTRRLMVFHQPQILALAQQFPDSDLLLGKPMPIQACADTYRRWPQACKFQPERQLSWLIDTPERAQQYAQLARQWGLNMKVSLEIDVGLHRGGLASPAALEPILPLLSSAGGPLHLQGFMGYDAHVGKIPALIESRSRSLQGSQASYRAFQETLYRLAPVYREQTLVMNGAGSPTFRWHDSHSPLNEVSAGSAFVKASDFDLDVLADLQPAVWIATPVLKASDGLHLPGIEKTGGLWPLWDLNRRRSYFIYGGEWRAHPVSPAGLQGNPLYGYSSNQDLLNGSQATGLRVDDQVFFRPTQSEELMLEFGDLAAIQADGRIDYWPVLPG